MCVVGFRAHWCATMVTCRAATSHAELQCPANNTCKHTAKTPDDWPPALHKNTALVPHGRTHLGPLPCCQKSDKRSGLSQHPMTATQPVTATTLQPAMRQLTGTAQQQLL